MKNIDDKGKNKTKQKNRKMGDKRGNNKKGDTASLPVDRPTPTDCNFTARTNFVKQTSTPQKLLS